MVAIAAKVDGQALVGSRRDRRGPRHGRIVLAGSDDRIGVFLAVVSSLFALFISAYFMRMQVADWVQLPAPKLLWFNTGVLILSSVALQYAQVAARRGRGRRRRRRPDCRRPLRLNVPGWAAPCVATAERRRLLLSGQPRQRLLLSVHPLSHTRSAPFIALE